MDDPARMPDHPATPEASLLRQASPELGEALGLLRRLFDVRITFFDLGGVEAGAGGFDIKPISAYCAARRREPAFNARCLACDRRHLDQAKGARGIRIYQCHDGLVEGVIPLYGRDGDYLGAIMFGQLRPPRDAAEGRTPAMQRLRSRLPLAEPRRLRDLAELLKWLSEHLAVNTALRLPALPWAEAARRYLAANLGNKLSLAGLARAVGRSPSFISHRFPAAFGTSFARHVRGLRLAEVRKRLARGTALAAVAAELGFCDRFHLSRAYSAHFGQPPRGPRRRSPSRR